MLINTNQVLSNLIDVIPDSMPKILHQFTIAAPPEVVFTAFCTPEGLNAWWTLRSSGIPQLGTEYTFYFAPEYDWRAKVVKVIPNKALTWQMTVAMED